MQRRRCIDSWIGCSELLVATRQRAIRKCLTMVLLHIIYPLSPTRSVFLQFVSFCHSGDPAILGIVRTVSDQHSATLFNSIYLEPSRWRPRHQAALTNTHATQFTTLSSKWCSGILLTHPSLIKAAKCTLLSLASPSISCWLCCSTSVSRYFLAKHMGVLLPVGWAHFWGQTFWVPSGLPAGLQFLAGSLCV